jgi:hypothetical protein
LKENRRWLHCFFLIKSPPGELTSIGLKNEARKYIGNPTLETYRMTVDREPAPGEVLYAGDRRMAAVAWKGMVYLREEVGSANEAFEQVLDETETGSMEAHRRLLERAAGGQLPERIDDQSTPEFDIFQELIEADCVFR